MHLVSIRITLFTQQKQWGLYQNKATSSLVAIQRPGHWADNGKMVNCFAIDKDWVQQIFNRFSSNLGRMFLYNVAQKTVSAFLVFPVLLRVINKWRNRSNIFSNPQVKLGVKNKPGEISKFADTVFETKVLRTWHTVCLFLLITPDCTGTEYCKACTFAKGSQYF